jgi:hypothetical protein
MGHKKAQKGAKKIGAMARSIFAPPVPLAADADFKS